MEPKKILRVLKTYAGCPYCFDSVGPDDLGCCGESRTHFTKIVELENGFIVTSEELEELKKDFEIVDEET